MKYNKRRRVAACSGSDGEDEILPSQHRKRAIDAMEGRLANLAGEVSALQSALEDLRKRQVELAAEGDFLNAQLQGLQSGSTADRARDAQALGSGSTRGSDPGSTFHFSMFTAGEPSSPAVNASAERRRAPSSKPKQQALQVPADTRSTDEHQDHLTQIGPPLAGDPWDEIMMPICHAECAEAELALTECVLPFAAAGSTTGSPASGAAPVSASGGNPAGGPGQAAAPAGAHTRTLTAGQAAAASRAPGGSGHTFQGALEPSAASGVGGMVAEEAPRGMGVQRASAGGASASGGGGAFDGCGLGGDPPEGPPSDTLWWNSLLPSTPLPADMGLTPADAFTQQQQQQQQHQQQNPTSPPQLLYTQHSPSAAVVALPPPAVLAPPLSGSGASVAAAGGGPHRPRQQQHQMLLPQHSQIQPAPHQAVLTEALPRCRGRGQGAWPPPGGGHGDGMLTDAAAAAIGDDGMGVIASPGMAVTASGTAPGCGEAGLLLAGGVGPGRPYGTAMPLGMGAADTMPSSPRDRRAGMGAPVAAAGMSAGGSPPQLAEPLGLSLASAGKSLASLGARGGSLSRGWSYGLSRPGGGGGGGPAAVAAALLQNAGMMPSGGVGKSGVPMVGLGAGGFSGTGGGAAATPLLSASPSGDRMTALPSDALQLRRQVHQKGTAMQILQHQHQQHQQHQHRCTTIKLESANEPSVMHRTSLSGGCGAAAGTCDGGPDGGGVRALAVAQRADACTEAGIRRSDSDAPFGAGRVGSPLEGGGDSTGVVHHSASGGGAWALGGDGAPLPAPARSSSSPAAPAAGMPAAGMPSRPCSTAGAAAAGDAPPVVAAATGHHGGSTAAQSPPVTPRTVKSLSRQGSEATDYHMPPHHGAGLFPRAGSDGGAAGPAATASGLPLPVPSSGAPPYGPGPGWSTPYGSSPSALGQAYGSSYPAPVRYGASPGRVVVWRRMHGRQAPPLPMPGQGGLPPPSLPQPGTALGVPSAGGNFPQGPLPPPGTLGASPPCADAVPPCNPAGGGGASSMSFGGGAGSGGRPYTLPYTWSGQHAAHVSNSGAGPA